MMLLGTQDRDFFPQDLTEKFKFVKSIGFECFEIDGKVLMEKPDAPAADTAVGSAILSRRRD